MTSPPYPDFDGSQPCASTLPDAWFGHDHDDERQPLPFRFMAVRLCKSCPFLTPCRDWARAHDVHGTWGSETRRERIRWQKANGVTPIRQVLDPDDPTFFPTPGVPVVD